MMIALWVRASMKRGSAKAALKFSRPTQLVRGSEPVPVVPAVADALGDGVEDEHEVEREGRKKGSQDHRPGRASSGGVLVAPGPCRCPTIPQLHGWRAAVRRASRLCPYDTLLGSRPLVTDSSLLRA